MTVEDVGNVLPRIQIPPIEYLRAGLPVPPINNPFTVRGPEVVPVGQIPDLAQYPPDFQNAPFVYTAVDDDGNPMEVAYGRTNHYLTDPPRWRLCDVGEATNVERIQPLGCYFVTVGEAGRDQGTRYRKHAPDLDNATIVTVDSSVMIAGLRPSLFRPDDVLYISMAIAIDVEYCEVFYTQGDPRSADPDPVVTAIRRGWGLSVPVPIDQRVLTWYSQIMSRSDRLVKAGQLDRTDLLCAATAMVYETPMYTTKPEAYKGVVKGLKTLKYGPTRNKDADDDPQYPPVPNPPPPPLPTPPRPTT